MSARRDSWFSTATIAAAFTLSPPVAGQWQAQGDTARYLPEATWAPGTRYDWSLAAGAGGLRGADALAEAGHRPDVVVRAILGVVDAARYNLGKRRP